MTTYLENHQSNVPYPDQFISNTVFFTSECGILEQARTCQQRGTRKLSKMGKFVHKEQLEMLILEERRLKGVLITVPQISKFSCLEYEQMYLP